MIEESYWDEIEEDLKIIEKDTDWMNLLEKGEEKIREYSNSVEKDLKKIEIDSIDDYLRESESITKLHEELKSCDEILNEMEDMMNGFEKDLGDISENIKILQNKSFTIHFQLENRIESEEMLNNSINHLFISKELIRNLITSNLTDEKYINYLKELNEKTNFILTNNNEEMKRILKQLIFDSCLRIRNFLLKKINLFKNQKTNSQILKQNLLKYKYFNFFLKKYNIIFYKEISNIYKNIISKIYFIHFDNYVKSLKDLEIKILNDNIFQNQNDSFFSFFKRNNQYVSISFEERIKILNKFQPIISHISREKKENFIYDYLFKSMFILLIEISSSEYLFLNEFFYFNDDNLKDDIINSSINNNTSSSIHLEKEETDKDFFLNIFSKILNDIYFKEIKDNLKDNEDIIGLFLMILILNQLNFILIEQRNIKILKDFFEKIKKNLELQFKCLILKNIEMINQKIKENDDEFFENESISHDVSKRYGYLSSSIHKLINYLKKEKEKDEILKLMKDLRNSIEHLFNSLSKKFKNSKLKYIWLINSSDIILNYFIKNNLQVEDGETFHLLLNDSLNFFIEEELLQYCHEFILFTQKVEKKLKNSAKNLDILKQDVLIIILKNFNNNWKIYLKNIYNDILKYFKNLKSGTIILTKVYSQLLLYYSRFISIIYQFYSNIVPNDIKKLIIQNDVFLLEIKNYANDMKF
eukprot:gene185-4431_t